MEIIIIEQCAKFYASLTSMIILCIFKELSGNYNTFFDLDKCILPSVGKESCTIFCMCILEDGKGYYHNPLGHANDLAPFFACVN